MAKTKTSVTTSDSILLATAESQIKEKDRELFEICREFRDGILEGKSSERMCFAICAPLESYLQACGFDVRMVKGWVDLGDCCSEHFWLEIPGSCIIDPTADQFAVKRMPPIYIGARPEFYKTREHLPK